MALAATVVGEIRANGASDNGGWFDGSMGTPLLSPNDLVCAKGATTVTSAAGGFTAAMVGHCLVVTAGTNFKVAQYTILTRVDGNEITVDFSPCPNAAGTGGTATVSEGIDYSQQNAAEVTYAPGNHLDAAGAGADVTCDETPFTADDVGNSINVTGGTNLTTGWYIIESEAGGTATLDRAVATGACNDGTGKLGGANIIVQAWLETVVPGAHIHAKADGTHTLGALTMTADGTGALPWKFIGYNTTRGDEPTGTNRPLIDCGAATHTFGGNFGRWEHLRWTGTGQYAFRASDGTISHNCDFQLTSTTAGRYAAYAVSSWQMYINCSFSSPYGMGLYASTAETVRISRCMFRDCGQYGLLVTTAARWALRNCVFDTCGTAIEGTTGSGWSITGCTYYNCIQGIAPTAAAYEWLIENCIFAFNGDGANWEVGTDQLINWWDYNDWYGNTVDVSDVTKGDHDTAYDPLFPEHTSLTDLACVDHAGPPYDITSVTGFNGRWAAGDLIRIRGGGNWLAADAVYVVTAVVDANTLSLNTEPTNGGDAANGSAYTARSVANVQDFTLGAASDCRGAGIGLTLGV